MRRFREGLNHDCSLGKNFFNEREGNIKRSWGRKLLTFGETWVTGTNGAEGELEGLFTKDARELVKARSPI